MYFGYFGLFISLCNLLVSFCPKNIEAVFSSLFFAVENCSYIWSIFLSGIILKVLDFDFEKDKNDLYYLFGINTIMISISFFIIKKLHIPT